MTEKVMFCSCGRPLVTSMNARYDHKVPGHCNQKCKDAEEKKQKRGPKQGKKYGATGWIYS